MSKYSSDLLGKARAYLLENGPQTSTSLAAALRISRTSFSRLISAYGEEMGLQRFRRKENGTLRVFWKANPNYRPGVRIVKAPVEPPLSPQQKAERAAADRLAENLRRFRQEPPRYAGGRRRV